MSECSSKVSNPIQSDVQNGGAYWFLAVAGLKALVFLAALGFELIIFLSLTEHQATFLKFLLLNITNPSFKTFDLRQQLIKKRLTVDLDA